MLLSPFIYSVGYNDCLKRIRLSDYQLKVKGQINILTNAKYQWLNAVI